MENELVSIIMPVYKAEKYISQALESILNQSYCNFELIIIYNYPEEKSLDIIRQFSDYRIKTYYIPEKQNGISNQLNYGIKQAKGNYIARMDADDIAMPDKLQKQIDFLNSNKDIDIVGTNAYFLNEKGERLLYKIFPEFHKDIEFMMPVINSILHPTILTYKNILSDSGGYKNLKAEDHELYLRLLTNGYKFHNLQEPLFCYRIIEKNREYYEAQDKCFYESSKEYLHLFYSGKNSRLEKGEFYMKAGILEYYKGSIWISRKLLLKSCYFLPAKTLIIFRYFIFTLLGSGLLKYLRQKKITSKVNSFILNKFNFDTYNIKSTT